MCNKRNRLLAVLLVMVLLVSVVSPVNAVGSSADNIKQQIKQTFRKAQIYFGTTTFDGRCGTLTGIQIYLLGITTRVSLQNGNEGFDTYCNQEMTSGGYRVRAYSAKRYTLEQALNQITQNGTVDAYNLLVGFEATPSSRGQRYGHSLFVHAILDGTVYFVESYDLAINGKRYSEGSPVSCSIAEFCEYYRRNTKLFDGVIHFGLKTYTELCVDYPASFYAAALKDAQLRSQPCTQGVDSGSKVIRDLTAGEQLTVTGVCLNTVGEYWYRVEGKFSGYIRAEDAQVRQFLYDDVTVRNLNVPTALNEGSPFYISGDLVSDYNSIYTVRAQVYRLDGDTEEQVIGATDVADSKVYSLSGSTISRNLTFRKLTQGVYRYSLAAVVGNYHVRAGELVAEWNTVELWTSEFCVAANKNNTHTVTYDAGGGSISSAQTVLPEGYPLGTLPTAKRPDYVFLGWYTQAEGGERVTAEYVPQGNVTLYARWYSAAELQAAWTQAGECWYFYADGLSSMGCMEVDGTFYYFSMPDAFGQNGIVWATTH